jgi:hypothetical protein
MGRLDEARAVIQRPRRVTPLIAEGFSYFRNTEHREFLLSGLRGGQPKLNAKHSPTMLHG